MVMIKNLLASYLGAIFLGLVTVLLLYLVAQERFGFEFAQVLIVVAGMTTFAALTLFLRSVDFRQSVERTTSASPSYVSFNEVVVSQSISEAPIPYDVVSTDEGSASEPWDLTIQQFIGLDNSLALAKLRIDLERELRRIAHDNETDTYSRLLGVNGMAQELVSRDLLPAIWLGALKEITSVCNRAVHGSEISNDVTVSVARAGGQLLARLRSVNKK